MATVSFRALGELDDHGLVAEVRCGSDEAFAELFSRYQRRITAYIKGMVGDHGIAEDITQDVFMSALRRMRETDRPIAFKPWVYEIAKNACIDQFRRSRRAEEISYDADGGLAPADHGRLVSSGPAPDAAVDNKMALDNLCGAFGSLSQTHHDVLVLRELEGLSYREIGERMGLTRPAVESTLFRARRRLSEEYEELVSGERCRRIQAIMDGGEGLGARERRRMARHLSHCQGCRRHARIAGFRTPAEGLRAKAAALVPAVPGLRWLRDRLDVVHTTAANSTASFANVLGPVIETGGAAWSKAAAATTALLAIGAGVAINEGPRPISSPEPAPVVRGSGPADGASAVAGSAADRAPLRFGELVVRRREALAGTVGGRGTAGGRIGDPGTSGPAGDGWGERFGPLGGGDASSGAEGPARSALNELTGSTGGSGVHHGRTAISNAGAAAEDAGVAGGRDAAAGANNEIDSAVGTVRELLGE